MIVTKTIFAIDPDVEASGTALLTPRGELAIGKMPFPELISYLQTSARQYPNDIIVVVEKGWFNETNYHLNMGLGVRVAAKQGINIGRNHETGRKIVEMAKFYGLQVEEMPPLKKIWKGQGGKISKEELESFAGPLPRCSQDERDAALLAWVYSGRPIRVNTNHK